MKIVAETDELEENIKVVLDDNALFQLYINEQLVQPNHNAEGIIRALICQLQYYGRMKNN